MIIFLFQDDYKPPKKVKKLKKLKIKVKKDYDENNENYNEENNDYQEVDNDYDEDKPIKRKKKRGPKGEGKIKVSYISIIKRSLGGFGRLLEVLGALWEDENYYDEDKHINIKHKKKRGPKAPKGEGKVKVSYILILSTQVFWRLWEALGGLWEYENYHDEDKLIKRKSVKEKRSQQVRNDKEN